MAEFTFRNIVQRPLTYNEVDDNLRRVQELHDEALEARDVAVSDTILYPNTTAGLAATAEGGYFVVPNTATDELVYYRKVSGAAVEQIRIFGNSAVTTSVNTFVSGQKFGSGSGNADAIIDGGASSIRALRYRTAGLERFALFTNNAAEGGSNAGSDFAVARYDDAGSYLGQPLTIKRSDGGVTLGIPTGGSKGNGTLNAQGVYDDNVLLTCYAIDAYKTGNVDIAYWDSVTPDREIPEVPEQRTEHVVAVPAKPAKTEVRTHVPAARFAARAAELLDPKSYGAAWKATGHLPAMPSPAEWEAAGKKMAVGDILQRLWETVECQSVHIDNLLERIETLEAKS